MTKRPGFVSATGIVVAIVLLLGIVTWDLVRGPALFSPGPLNAEATGPALGGVTNHAQLGDDCGACHPPPSSSATMADRCLDCHKAIGADIKAKEGIHGRLAGAQSSPTCRGCHPEHNGPKGALTSLDGVTFPHDLTGFSLRGHRETAKGARFACTDCHPKDYTTFDQSLCSDCHAAIDAAFMSRHEAAYGKDCLACHDGSGGGQHRPQQVLLQADRQARRGGVQRLPLEAPDPSRTTGTRHRTATRATPRTTSTTARTGASAGTATPPRTGAMPLSITPSSRSTTAAKSARPPARRATRPITKSYTCYGCHEHTTGNVLNQHEGKSLAELADCIECHPGGRQGGD